MQNQASTNLLALWGLLSTPALIVICLLAEYSRSVQNSSFEGFRMVLRLTSDLPIAAGSDAHGCVGGERSLGTSEKELAPHMEIWRSVLYAIQV